MRILVVEPGKKPEVREINGSLESMQEIVGGTIEAIYPWNDPVALVCNDEGKLLGLPLNRVLIDEETRAVYDMVAGIFFLCGVPDDGDRFVSLTDEQLENYQKRFAAPETILVLGRQMIVLQEED